MKTIGQRRTRFAGLTPGGCSGMILPVLRMGGARVEMRGGGGEWIRNAGIKIGLGMMMELEVMLAREDRRALPLKPTKQGCFLFSRSATLTEPLGLMAIPLLIASLRFDGGRTFWQDAAVIKDLRIVKERLMQIAYPACPEDSSVVCGSRKERF